MINRIELKGGRVIKLKDNITPATFMLYPEASYPAAVLEITSPSLWDEESLRGLKKLIDAAIKELYAGQ